MLTSEPSKENREAFPQGMCFNYRLAAIRKNALIYLLLTLLFVPKIGEAQKRETCRICKENIDDHIAPYNTSLKHEWPYLAVGTGLAVGGFLFKTYDNVVPYTQEQLNALNRNDINSFDRGATYNNSQTANTASNLLVLGTAVLPAVFLTGHHTGSDIGSIALITYEVVAINYGITNTVKSFVNRPRPYVYNPDLSYAERTDADSRYSFFSGHTSVTASFSFLFAKVLTDYHPNMDKGLKIGIWSFASLLPATTGYFRVQAGKHYPTDVITGYLVGASIGWLVPQLHKKGKDNFSVYPTWLYNHQALGFTWKF